MAKIKPRRKYTALDIHRISNDELDHQPVSHWSTVDILIEDSHETACIASWRRDVESSSQVSQKLAGCVRDARELGYSYLLCDLVSLPQQAPDTIERLIEFNQLYTSLHAVLAHDVDVDLRRTWIMAEARRVLQSRTSLSYVLKKWQLSSTRMETKPDEDSCIQSGSITMRQICRMRLGLQEINTRNLGLCDSKCVEAFACKDLNLMDGHPAKPYVTLSLDRRRQAYASDVLLVWEVSRDVPHWPLIGKLRRLMSNSAAVASLVLIWAMVEGISVSVRGCDWPAGEIVSLTADILSACCEEDRDLSLSNSDKGRRFTLSGAIEASLSMRVMAQPGSHSAEGSEDVWVFCRDTPAAAEEPSRLSGFLEACVSWVHSAHELGLVKEPPPLCFSSPRYTLDFDDEPHSYPSSRH